MRKYLFLAVLALFLTLCSPVLLNANWPQFRGPFGNGHAQISPQSPKIGLPLEWSETKNIAWKTPIPHRGWSSPVVANGKIWLTTAEVDGHDFYVICVDGQSGKILLNRRLFHTDDPEPLGNPVNCYASPTPVAEPGRVYISFGSYGTACLNSSTYEELWRRTDIPCRHYRGPGSSPILFENLLILTMDGVDLQYMIALDKNTGKTVWKTDRSAEWNDLDSDGKPFREGDLRKAYSTPLIVNVGSEKQMLTIGSKAAYGYDPATGKELWKVRHECYSAAAMPVYADKVAYMVTGFGRTELWAVRTDGSGDVTDTHILWKTRRMVPRTPSPLLIDDLLYTISDNGVAVCLDTATGRDIWTERLKGAYAASCIYADGRIYAFSQQGLTTVFEPGREYRKIAENKLESGFMASPALLDNALILRTKTHLYRIESAD